MRQRLRQRPKPEGLARDEAVQHDAHHQGLVGRGQHLVELIDDHRREVPPARQPADRRGAVVELQAVGDVQQRTGAGGQPDRPVVEPEVEHVAVARLLQQIEGVRGLGEPGRGPAQRRPALPRLDRVTHGGEIGGLGRLGHAVERVGVADPMRHHLAARGREGAGQLRRVVVDRGVEQNGERDLGAAETIEDAEGPDAVAVVAPGGVGEVGMRDAGQQVLGQALAEGVVLDPQREIDREPRAVRPGSGRLAGDGDVRIAAVGCQHGSSPTQRFIPTSRAAARRYISR